MESGGNVFAELIETVEHCSLGQITERLHEVVGPLSPDGMNRIVQHCLASRIFASNRSHETNPRRTLADYAVELAL